MDSPLRLHLGCGPKFISGFVHIDSTPFDHLDVCSDVSSLSWIQTSTVSLIYACHILEHFGRHKYKKVLQEWYRVISPGGILRLSVPDFHAVVELYSERGLEDGLSGLVGLVCGGQRDSTDFHKMIFDSTLLTDSLLEVGFSSVRPWDWRDTDHSHIDDYSQAYLPHLDKEHGKLMSLNLEATK